MSESKMSVSEMSEMSEFQENRGQRKRRVGGDQKEVGKGCGGGGIREGLSQ